MRKYFHRNLSLRIRINAVLFIITTTTIGKCLNYLGRENTILSGMFFLSIQQLGLAYITTIDDPAKFLRISFIVQAIGGVGSGANSVASMALMIAVSKKEERDRNIGLFEGFTGLGFMAGPLIGSFLFTVGGYIMPFAFSGLFFVLCFPFVAY